MGVLMLSVIIPAREEVYLERTIRNILENAEGEIEIIVELDGWMPNPQIAIDDDRVIFEYHKEVIGQRACINHGVSISKGKYIMKLDAHCAVDKGFDVKLAADCEPDWTVIPRMYNLDANEHVEVKGVKQPNPHFWKPKLHKKTDYMYITGPTAEKPFRAMYYGGHKPKSDKLIDETMCNMGPGWFMHKERFLYQGGCDEGHEGGWGQQGIEVSLKAWLSGGKLIVNKKTWFAHWFRGGGGPGFPYKISGNQINRVRKYSQDLWLNNKWEKQTRTIEWLVEKFNPPGWVSNITILYYTANTIEKGMEYSVLRNLRGLGLPIVSISQEPMSDLGKNIVVPKKRSLENIYKQVLIGAKAATTKYVALCEDDCLYTLDHFKYRPTKDFAYNLNRWNLHLEEKVYSYWDRVVLSQCIANREALIKCLEATPGRNHEPGRKKDGYEYETFKTKQPNIVFCQPSTSTGRRRKLIGKDAEPRTEIKPWGTAEYWATKFAKRRRRSKKK